MIVWNEQVITDPASFFVPPHSAYTPQVPRLFSGTLKENILLGLAEAQADLSQAIHLAVLERDLAEMPAGIDTLVGRGGVRLSGGQAQRTAGSHPCVSRPTIRTWQPRYRSILGVMATLSKQRSRSWRWRRVGSGEDSRGTRIMYCPLPFLRTARFWHPAARM